MKSMKSLMFAAALAICLNQVAQAQVATEAAATKVSAEKTSTDAKECTGKCATGEGTCEKCASGECPIAAAMEKLPKLTFMVGTEETCCNASAESIAKEKHLPVIFVVGEKKFEKQAEAMSALADSTEAFVNDFTAPHTCNVSGKTSLAGAEMTCSEQAGKIALAMKEAMQTIAISYKVGDKSCDCPNEAKTLAAKSGAATEFVVGEECTSCPIDARIKLAKAKFRAALEAMHKSIATTTSASSETATDVNKS